MIYAITAWAAVAAVTGYAVVVFARTWVAAFPATHPVPVTPPRGPLDDQPAEVIAAWAREVYR